MPTYQYACTTCGHRLEVVQSFTDDPLTECPACEGSLRKLFSAVGIVFKGSGFYRTDSRSSGTSKSSSMVGAGSPKSDSTGTGSDTAGSTTSAAAAPAASGASGASSKPAAVATAS